MAKKLFTNFNINNITFGNAFSKFQLNNKSRGLSDETIQYYRRCRNSFARFIYAKTLESITDDVEKEEYVNTHEKGMDLSLLCSDINKDYYSEYSAYLLETAKSEQTAKTLLVGIKAFLNFAIEEEMIPYFKMKIMKVDEVHKEPYSREEIEALLVKPDLKKCDFVEYRTWVMENLAYAVGMRLGAMLNLKVKDVDLEYRYISVERTKRRKSQNVRMSTVLTKIMTEYIQARGGLPDDYLFCTQFGTKLEKRSAEDAIADYNKARGVSKTSIHLLRHTFAKDFLLNGGKTNELQAILDHSTSVMTMKYASLYDIDLGDNFDASCPLDSVYHDINKEKIKVLKKKK